MAHGMMFDAAMRQAEQAHCLTLVSAGAGWDSFVLAKARALDKKRAYRGIAGEVERAITDAGRKLPGAWDEPAGVEVFTIPANYRQFVAVEKGKRC